MLIDFVIALAVSVLCGLGGGGGIFVLYLTAFGGLKQVTAQGVNLIFFLSSAVGAFGINRKNKLIDFKICVFILLSGIPMAILGALVASKVGNELLSKMYGCLLIISGVYYLFKKQD